VEGGKQKSGGETDEARKEAEDKAKEKESEVAEKLKELAEKKKELEDSKKALKELEGNRPSEEDLEKEKIKESELEHEREELDQGRELDLLSQMTEPPEMSKHPPPKGDAEQKEGEDEEAAKNSAVKKEEVGVEEERALKEETEYAENVAQNHHHAPPELLCKWYGADIEEMHNVEITLQERLVKAQDEEWGDQVVEFQTALAQMATRLRDMKAKREKACHEAKKHGDQGSDAPKEKHHSSLNVLGKAEGGEEGDKKSGGVSFGSVPPSSSLLLGAFCVLASSLKI